MAKAKVGQGRAAVRALPVEAAEIFTERDLRLIDNCKVYAAADPAGLPGHNLLLIIDKLDDLVGELIEGRREAELNDIVHSVGYGDG